MTFNDLLALKGFTVYSLSKKSGVPKSTVFDIASGKTDLLECTGKTLRAIAMTMEVSIEDILALENDKSNNYPEFLKLAISRVRASVKSSSYIKSIYLKQLKACVDTALNQKLISEKEADNLKERYELTKEEN